MMKVPLLRMVAVGHFSSWSRQTLKAFEEQEIIEITPEPSFDSFGRSLLTELKPQVILVENNPECEKNILKLCQTGKALYVVWIGKSFTKENMAFALENRIYMVIDSTQRDEKKITASLRKLSLLVDGDNQFLQILRAVKAVLLQMESEFPEIPMLNELKNAAKRLENYGLNNELNHLVLHPSGGAEEVLFYRVQDFGDALVTIRELERTGVLWVRGQGKEQEGKIEFLFGKIVGSLAGRCEGVKAVERMFLWDTPRFFFNRKEPSEFQYVETLDVDVTQLARKGVMLKQRYEKIRSEIPMSGFRLELNPSAINKDTQLFHNDFSVLASVLEFGLVSNILDYSPLSDLEVFESLISLRRQNIVRKLLR